MNNVEICTDYNLRPILVRKICWRQGCEYVDQGTLNHNELSRCQEIDVQDGPIMRDHLEIGMVLRHRVDFRAPVALAPPFFVARPPGIIQLDFA